MIFFKSARSDVKIRQNAPSRIGVTDSAITEFGIKRQKGKSGISYNAFSANPESPIMETAWHKGISHNVIFSKSGISKMETATMESPIMSYSANPETPIMETAIKESPIKSTQENRKSGEKFGEKNHLIRLHSLFILWDWFELSKCPLDMIEPY
jgi:hypothetical protein